MNEPQLLRISHVGVRGVVGPGLTASHVLDFASAFGTFLAPKVPVVLGRDTRASGVMIREGVIAALLATGHDVIDLGVVSTPVIQHTISRIGAGGGVSIGASHNAAEWNALKFFGPNGIYLSTAEASELLDIYHLKKFDFVGWTEVGKLCLQDNAIDPYLDDLAQVFDLESLRQFKVLVDCCNGTSALILRRMKERFGLNLILINEKTEGVDFAHDPAISRETVGLQLAPLMQPVAADAGFLFDADSDRVAIATEEGNPVSEEMILPILADYVLPRVPGRLVITNISTTALVEEVASRHGAKVVRAPVGRQAAIDALTGYRPEQVALAGEGTGAVMMPQFRFVYDGIASMLAILSMMAERKARLSEIVDAYPRYSMLKGQLPFASRRLPELLMEIQMAYSDGRVTSIDGLRVDWPDRWFHVRVSQTEPVVRVICEQRGDPPIALFEDLMGRVRSYV
ncbi:MAG: phosphoglucosamine mutase [Bryobacteraceae bacterium]|nr:phosphoglucosamine mutase [Bryobacteraceae bacterium]